MSNNSNDATPRGAHPSTARGDRTRDRLLDALEAIAADDGVAALSHRAIARRARLHSGLIHYHFGTVERLIEDALARRAARLSHAQLAEIGALTARGQWTAEEVIAALWQPFSALGGALEGGWRNYLCLVSRLASDPRGDELLSRHFEEVDAAVRRALRAALPRLDDDALSLGLRYTRILFERESIARCRKSLPAERRAFEDRQLAAFAAAGIRGLGNVAGAALVDVSDQRSAS